MSVASQSLVVSGSLYHLISPAKLNYVDSQPKMPISKNKQPSGKKKGHRRNECNGAASPQLFQKESYVTMVYGDMNDPQALIAYLSLCVCTH